MNPTLQYYLGSLATRLEVSHQAKELRDILFSSTDDDVLFGAVQRFIAEQKELYADTVSILNIAVLPGYGSEYFGLGEADWNRKAEFFKSLIAQFPKVISFKFKYADCACMAGLPVQEFYSILEEGILLDTSKAYYPSHELFEVLQDSEFNFQFDLLVLDNYSQPCSENDFKDYVDELKEQYTTLAQTEQLNALRWKGQDSGG